MDLPTFVHLQRKNSRSVYYVDVPEDFDELLMWIYVTAKSGVFPLTLEVFGSQTTFDSTESMVGFAVGAKRLVTAFKATTAESLFS